MCGVKDFHYFSLKYRVNSFLLWFSCFVGNLEILGTEDSYQSCQENVIVRRTHFQPATPQHSVPNVDRVFNMVDLICP